MFMLWFRLVVHCTIITISNHGARTHALPAAALNTLNMFRRAALYRAVLYTVHRTVQWSRLAVTGGVSAAAPTLPGPVTTDQCTLGGRFVSAEMRRYWLVL